MFGLRRVIIRLFCETIHPGTKEGTLQKGQELNPTHRHSEGPYHNLEKIRASNTVLHQHLTFWRLTTQIVVVPHR